MILDLANARIVRAERRLAVAEDVLDATPVWCGRARVRALVALLAARCALAAARRLDISEFRGRAGDHAGVAADPTAMPAVGPQAGSGRHVMAVDGSGASLPDRLHRAGSGRSGAFSGGAA